MTNRTIQQTIALPEKNHGRGFRERTLDPNTGFRMDPFLVASDFGMNQAYFPPHPHAGFGVMTYVFLDSPGSIVNRDSFGDHSTIEPGGLHWTQAGRGVQHEEIPQTEHLDTHGLQLWINLQADDKLTTPRAFHKNRADVPEFSPAEGVLVRVVAGETNGVQAGFAPLTPVTVLDVHLAPFTSFTHPLPAQHTAFLFTQRGGGKSGEGAFGAGEGVFFANDGDAITIKAGADGLQTLLLSGQPIDEPVAFGGPFVFNTQQQIHDARVRFGRGEMGSLSPSPVFGR
jgi:redox-sensitive bicupin YhaK (pirin superfamily)